MTVHPSGNWLFVSSDFEAGQGAYFQTFALDPATGAILTPIISEVDLGFAVFRSQVSHDGERINITNGTDALLSAAFDPTTGVLSSFESIDSPVPNPTATSFFFDAIK